MAFEPVQGNINPVRGVGTNFVLRSEGIRLTHSVRGKATAPRNELAVRLSGEVIKEARWVRGDKVVVLVDPIDRCIQIQRVPADALTAWALTGTKKNKYGHLVLKMPLDTKYLPIMFPYGLKTYVVKSENYSIDLKGILIQLPDFKVIENERLMQNGQEPLA